MAMDFARLRDAIVKGIAVDPDGKYTGDMVQPTDSDELAAFCHYIAKAVVEEIDTNAEIQARIEVEDGTGTIIGATRAGAAGVID